MRRFRSSLARPLLTALFLLLVASVAFAGTFRPAPINPEFLKYREEAADPALKTAAAEGRPLGYRPGPLDLSHVRAPEPEFLESAATLPASYDLRIEGAVTAIRDQAPYGTCWAFGALASLESTFRKAGKGTFDFSEWHLAYFAYVDESASLPAFTQRAAEYGDDPIFDQGGNVSQATALLARWTGAVDEAARPYQNVTPWPPESTPQASDAVSKHLEQVHLLKTGNDFDAPSIKRAVMTYGAVAFRMEWRDSFFSVENAAYYAPEGTTGGGHIVTLVGWDDSFPAERFAVNPGQNGAWLVKNSWGTAFGNEGYFWLSYADVTLGYPAVFVGADKTNYSRVYQYDPLGWINSIGNGNETAWFANVFTASGLGSETEALKAVSFYAGQAGASYRIEVYTGRLLPDRSLHGNDSRLAPKRHSLGDDGEHPFHGRLPHHRSARGASRHGRALCRRGAAHHSRLRLPDPPGISGSRVQRQGDGASRPELHQPRRHGLDRHDHGHGRYQRLPQGLHGADDLRARRSRRPCRSRRPPLRRRWRRLRPRHRRRQPFCCWPLP